MTLLVTAFQVLAKAIGQVCKPRTFVPLAVLVAMLLTGCVVGPDFKKPPAPQVDRYTATTLPTTTESTNVAGGNTQRFVNGMDIPREWWAMFHSCQLNTLIERSLKNNPNLKAAQSALAVANENVLAQKGLYYPNVSAGFSGARQHTSNTIAPVPDNNSFQFSLFTPQVSVSYTPDVFGLNRRTVESLQAQADAARFEVAATDITLTSNVVAAAVQEASLRDQIAATRQLITINNDMLNILKAQFAKGYVARLDVAAQEAQLAQVVATLPPLVKQLAQQRDLLAVLSGDFASQGPAEKFELSDLQLPGDLPVSLPSQLVAQRPDVLQAQENLHAASAEIGVAVANRLPNVTLTADAGYMALALGEAFASRNEFWTLAGSVAQPIFDGGALVHKELAARAAFAQAEQQYRATVQAAFQNVADTLNALDQDAAGLKAASASKDAAQITLDLSRKQWQTGYTDYLVLLNAEQAYQQAVIILIQAQTNRYADTAALFQALGGGWWNGQ